MSTAKKLYLIKREISPYTGEDLFLGVYDRLELANLQKDTYIADCQLHDEWKDQAYKVVDLLKDVQLVSVEEKIGTAGFPKEGQPVYLVSRSFEGMGQITKELFSILIDESKAKNLVETKNEEDDDEDFPNYYLVEELILNARNIKSIK